jgi:hypothetical protein
MSFEAVFIGLLETVSHDVPFGPKEVAVTGSSVLRCGVFLNITVVETPSSVSLCSGQPRNRGSIPDKLKSCSFTIASR